MTLSGVMEPRSYGRLDELRSVVVNRYAQGSSLETDEVLIEPDAAELREAVSTGVLAKVLERLQAEAQSPDETTQRVARHALKHLYRIASEAVSV